MNIPQISKTAVLSLISLGVMSVFSSSIYAQTKEDHDNHAHEHDHDKVETILVTSTRLGRTVNTEPVRIEVINREELEEKAIMRPGNISMLVAETGGVRVQTTSPTLGSANIRLQGLYGRYTQLLNDSLPLFGGQASSIGLLQIPPTDLASVEIIKGAASSLFGGSAMGGVINLISRKPTQESQAEVLLNATSQDGQDLTSYFAKPINAAVGISFTGGAHHQSHKDLDNDGWIDIAGYERYTARPRLFWDGEDGSNIYATIGLMTENRRGGTRAGSTVPDNTFFAQNQDSERVDAGIIANTPINEDMTFGLRASAMLQNHDKRFGDSFDDDRHESYLLEGSVKGYTQKVQWLMGIAMQSDSFTSQQYPSFDYSYDAPGIFAQTDYDLTDQLSASLSGRWDDHSEFGSQFSPRISILYRPDTWTIRGSYGKGYFAPTPFVEEIEDAGLSRLEPLDNIHVETAVTSSIDIGYRFDKLESNITLFSSIVDGVTQLSPYSSQENDFLDRVKLINAVGESRIYGTELLLRYKWQDYKLTASYLYLDATELNAGENIRQQIDLTPQHSAGFVAMKEQHGKFRIGFEAYYTGVQRLEGNPYLNQSKPYWHLGLLGEITRGRLSYFINMENLLNIRQTKEDSLLLPQRAASGQWTTDIWSRNDGFIVNAGVRVRF